MRNLKLFTFLILGIALASCQKEIVEPVITPSAKHDVDISFKIYPTNDYSDPKFDGLFYDDILIRIYVGIDKRNKKTGKTEKLLDSLFPLKKLRDYKLPFDTIKISKKIKDVIDDDEEIAYLYTLQYLDMEGNRNLSSSSTWSPLNNTIKSKEIILPILRPF